MKKNCLRRLKLCIALALVVGALTPGFGNDIQVKNDSGLRVATFDIDATPPIGSHMGYQLVSNVWDMGLRARGIVLLGAGKPIVLCALDWLCISNESHDAFKVALAEAAGTSVERVSVHTLHQHDAPRSDFNTERILKNAGLEPVNFDGAFTREVIRQLATAVHAATADAQSITHIGLGEAEVFKVASNRRILGADGRVRAGRMSSAKD